MKKTKINHKTRKKELTIDFIDYKILVIVTPHPELYANTALRRRYSNLPPIPGPFTAVHIDYDAYPRQSFIIVPTQCKEGAERVLLHELTHAVDHIIEFFGFEGTEIRAYLLDYLFDYFKGKLL
jgi:hypothetical protein